MRKTKNPKKNCTFTPDYANIGNRNMENEELTERALALLKRLIATPSVSRDERLAADIMEQTIRELGYTPQREANNVWIIDPHYDEHAPPCCSTHISTR